MAYFKESRKLYFFLVYLLWVTFVHSQKTPTTTSTSIETPGGVESRPSKATVAVVSSIAGMLVVGVISTMMVKYLCKRRRIIFSKREMFSSISPTRYTYSQLKKFTNNFTSRLGEGGFGYVYKGNIHQDGSHVPIAVKILKKNRETKEQFMNKLATVGTLNHKNCIRILGYCVEGETIALVYELMENGSLSKYIYDVKKGKQLSPKQVYTIALETARGILHLHEGCNKKILHCDIKAPNILLDSNFSPKICDFGLAMVIDKDCSHVSLEVAIGTPGYSAPEMWLKTLGPVTEKSDVYSYGMLLLEMVGKRKNYDVEASGSSHVYFPEWLYNAVENDELQLLMTTKNIDDSLEIGRDCQLDDEEMDVVRIMCLVGLWCIQYMPSNRPSMSNVVQMLEGHAQVGTPPSPFPHKMTNTHNGSHKDVYSIN